MKIYEIMADAHREAGDTDKHRLKALDFLATCDEDDILALFNSGAFNHIVKDIVETATEDMTPSKKEDIIMRIMKATDDLAESKKKVF